VQNKHKDTAEDTAAHQSLIIILGINTCTSLEYILMGVSSFATIPCRCAYRLVTTNDNHLQF
jgi:hypothetical protein